MSHVWYLMFSFLFFVVESENYARRNCSTKEFNVRDCPPEIVVNWWNFPPYVFNLDSDDGYEVKGRMKEAVEFMIRKCCGACVTFKYLEPTKTPKMLIDKLGRDNSSALYFPLYGKRHMTAFQSYPYFPMIEPPGSLYFEKEIDPQAMPHSIMVAVIGGWPVFVLTLIMAAISGIIIWALDSFCNDDFPKSFFKGSWEGLWWAFISMTTVGYGDKVPKSFLAKVFAFVWVIIGIVIIGIFTGTISTSLTTLCLLNDFKLQDETVIALNQTQEQIYASRNSAGVQEVTNISEFVSKINRGQHAGGLLDSYVAGFYQREIRSLRFSNVIEDNEYTYGFVAVNKLNNVVARKCLRQTLIDNERHIDAIVRQMTVLKKIPGNDALEKSSRLLDANSVIFQNSVFLCLGLCVILLLLALAWEYLYYRPRNNRSANDSDTIDSKVKSDVSYLDVYGAQCRELEEDILNSVDQFYKSFNEKMDEIETMQGPSRGQGKKNERMV